MDYSVGSVADLISGSTTLNKPKVVRKQFKMKNKIKSDQKEENDGDDQTLIPNKNKTLKKEKELSAEMQSSRKKLKRKRSVSLQTKQVKTAKLSVNIDDEDNAGTDSEKSTDNSSKNKTKENVEESTPKNPDHTTVFVGNLPVSITHQKLQKKFAKFGTVVNARIRSIPVADPKLPKKVAAIKKQFHPERKSAHGYVTFATRTAAEKALCLNGKEFKDHHIRVNLSDEKQNLDKAKAIFLGNVSFAAEEEELWKLFESCGEIESVRLVRDRFTDIGKGFGYINFKSADSIELALQMGEVKLRDRILRISLYNGKAPKKAKLQKGQSKKTNKINTKTVKTPLVTTATKGQFQGKFATEKKKKFNKGNQQKKKLAKKIAPRTMSG